MDNTMRSMSASSKPNSGRIYDYLLGGHHYFAVDAHIAEQFIALAPFAPKLAKLIRWFLGVSIRKAIERGFTQFIDFASGIPTIDHIHSIAPGGTKVIYSDIDPITVDYGKEIIGNNPLVKYETCNIAHPEVLLESEAVKDLFGTKHKAAIGFSGICYFLPDEAIHHSMQVLYEWADEGSILFFVDLDKTISDKHQPFIQLYKQMNQYFTGGRARDRFKELIKPWNIEPPGFLSLEDWIGITPTITTEMFEEYGNRGVYGGFLIK